MQAAAILREHVAKTIKLTDEQFAYFFSHFKEQSFKKGQVIIGEGDRVGLGQGERDTAAGRRKGADPCTNGCHFLCLLKGLDIFGISYSLQLSYCHEIQ